MQRTRYIIILILPLALFSCKTSRPVIQAYRGAPDAGAYIEKYRDLAVSEMKRTGVPASITLAQGMIESDYGRSSLARDGNNHFGIKCHDDWTGPTLRHHDDRRNDCFRKYPRAEDSFYDHSDFLKSGSRYSFLFDLPSTDYKAWARGLRKAGYATNPDYANMLIHTIEENNLSYYDSGYKPGKKLAAEQQQPKKSLPDTVSEKPVDSGPVSPDNFTVAAKVPRIKENNRIQYIIVKDGETRESLEKDFQLLKWELPRYNELDNEFLPQAGQVLYLQPKRDRAEAGRETCVADSTDTMYSVSQKYGVKLSKLYEYNRMNKGEEPAPGSKIWLRAPKPVN